MRSRHACLHGYLRAALAARAPSLPGYAGKLLFALIALTGGVMWRSAAQPEHPAPAASPFNRLVHGRIDSMTGCWWPIRARTSWWSMTPLPASR